MTTLRFNLWLKVAAPFGLFVIAGALALAVWMQSLADHESHAIFAALARTNAEFIRSAHLPESEQMMQYLGRLLNMRAYLVSGEEAVIPPLDLETAPWEKRLRALRPEEGVVSAGNDFEAISAAIAGPRRLVLVRAAEPPFEFLRRRDTLLVLSIFVLASVALAGMVARLIVRPYLETRALLAEERRRREQAERLALLGRLATGLAHEIHNPLAAIRLHAQLLQSAPAAEMAGAVEEAAPVLVEETSRIEGIVNQWLFLARPEPPRTSEVDLARLVRRVGQAYAAAATHARVTVNLELPDTLPVPGDERRLVQAVGNVVLNAIQAMPRGGRLHVTAAADGREARLAFLDTGHGFSEEALRRGQELFYSEKEGGMGIGLSVTSEIVAGHGGRVEVVNMPAGGARVTFHLPAAGQGL